MKIFIGLLVTMLALEGVLTSPARNPNNDAEVISLPRRRDSSVDDDDVDDETNFKNFKGVIDTGAGYPFLQANPHPFAFNLGFFDSFEDIFRRLRTRLWPENLPGADDDSTADEVGFPVLNPKNGNTTSTVQIVDGHKIEVNETVYGDNNNIFRVRVVNVRPLDSGEEMDTSPSVDTNPSTSAPNKNNNAEEDDDSDERREPLAKKSTENDIDGPEHTTTAQQQQEEDTTMLPTTTTTAAVDEDNAANLNAAFVADNSLELEENQSGRGNIEAETNKPDDDGANSSSSSSSNNGNDDDNLEAATTAEEQPVEDAVSSLVDNERLTIENNEETEVDDNINESSQDDAAAAASEELIFEHESGSEDADSDAEVLDNSHSNYAAANKQREDASSSDDEGGAEAVEMNAEFDSEWANLAEDLANLNDKDNDLSNDIDVYDTVPVDLSNDIAVNDIAAAQADFPINPDAELIDVDGTAMTSSMPKFEKLSVAAAMNPTSYQPASHSQNMK